MNIYSAQCQPVAESVCGHPPIVAGGRLIMVRLRVQCMGAKVADGRIKYATILIGRISGLARPSAICLSACLSRIRDPNTGTKSLEYQNWYERFPGQE